MMSKIHTGEERIMYLLKETRFPLLDIIDFWIQYEQKLRKTIAGEDPLTTVYVTVEVWTALRSEVEMAKAIFSVAADGLEWTKQGISFNGIELLPFFSNHAKKAMLPHCSCLIMGNTSMAKLRGL